MWIIFKGIFFTNNSVCGLLMLDVGVYATIYTVLSQVLMINLNSIIIQNTTYIGNYLLCGQ